MRVHGDCAGLEDEALLQAVCAGEGHFKLPANGLPQRGETIVSRPPHNVSMQLHVETAQLAEGGGLRLGGNVLLKENGVCRAPDGRDTTGSHALKGRPCLDDLLKILSRECADAGPARRLELYKALALELDQRLTHGSAADTEPFGEDRLCKRPTRREFSGKDGCAQELDDLAGEVFREAEGVLARAFGRMGLLG